MPASGGSRREEGLREAGEETDRVVQFRGSHEDDPPAGPCQAVEPLPVTGHLLTLAVPETLVLQRQLVLGPGEIDAADPPPVDPDGVLRDRPGQVGPVDQQSQPGFLR